MIKTCLFLILFLVTTFSCHADNVDSTVLKRQASVTYNSVDSIDIRIARIVEAADSFKCDSVNGSTAIKWYYIIPVSISNSNMLFSGQPSESYQIITPLYVNISKNKDCVDVAVEIKDVIVRHRTGGCLGDRYKDSILTVPNLANSNIQPLSHHCNLQKISDDIANTNNSLLKAIVGILEGKSYKLRTILNVYGFIVHQ